MSTELEWFEAHRVSVEGLTWDDYIGNRIAAAEARALVGALRRPEATSLRGLEVPRGLLLWGPAGAGKTHLARIIAAELGSTMSHYEFDATELDAGRLRDLTSALESRTEAISIFIDEIDFWGMDRNDSRMSMKRRKTLIAALSAIDGFRRSRNVLWIGASASAPDKLDAALLRPGRLGLSIEIAGPDAEDRRELIAYYTRGVPLAADVDLARAVRFTGSSTYPAHIKQAATEAYLAARAEGRTSIGMADLAFALSHAGESETKPDLDPYRTAVHEAGHAVVATALGIPPSRIEVSTHANGQAGVNEFENLDGARMRLLGTLRRVVTVALGGLLAERLVFGEASTGASSDLGRVRMILSVGGIESTLEASAMRSESARGSSAAATDQLLEMSHGAREAARVANGILFANRAALERLAASLAANGVLSAEEVGALLADVTTVDPLAPAAQGGTPA